MAITVYTYNDKVLKNVATDKWLKKPEAPAGFVMNASNASISDPGTNSHYVSWESPSYPDNYDGDGKHYIVTNNNTVYTGATPYQLMYASSRSGGGPTVIDSSVINTIGTSTGTMQANPAPGGFGKYLAISFNGSDEAVQAYLANLTITILD